MKDVMRPIRGYFKVETVDENENVLDTYEDNNTVMALIPQLIAGQMSGLFQQDIIDNKYHIGAFALGTDGVQSAANGHEELRKVPDDRIQLFSEEQFWEPGIATSHRDKRRVYQMTWNTNAIGDQHKNVSNWSELSLQNHGSTFPHQNYVPVNYREKPPINDKQEGMYGYVSLYANVISYKFTLGQFAGNEPNALVKYNEAGLYLRLGKNDVAAAIDPRTGNPLGTLFAMKTFPTQYKTNNCAIRVTWKLYF